MIIKELKESNQLIIIFLWRGGGGLFYLHGSIRAAKIGALAPIEC